jgi:hypothetical protein
MHKNTPHRFWGLPGNGPWKILPECSGKTHNSLYAAKGKSSRGTPKCICPRALALLKEHRKAQKPYAAEYLQRRREAGWRNTALNINRSTYRQADPDLTGGSCMAPYGQKLMDRAEGTTKGAVRNQYVREVKEMCWGCKRLDECGSWVVRAEDPPGTWGGIYAGMTRDERMKRAALAARESGEQTG